MTQFFLHSSQRSEPTVKYVPELSLANVLYAIWPLFVSLVILLLLNMIGSWLAGAARAATSWVKASGPSPATKPVTACAVMSWAATTPTTRCSRPSFRYRWATARAREALQKQPPDKASARAGLIAGGNHADDVTAMIWLFLNAQFHPNIKGAITAWTAGDAGIEDMVRIGKQAYALHSAGNVPPAALNALADKASAVSARLVKLEYNFSTEIAKAARDMSVWHTRLDIAVAAMLLAMGFVIARRMLMQRHAAKAAARRSAERLELAAPGRKRRHMGMATRCAADVLGHHACLN